MTKSIVYLYFNFEVHKEKKSMANFNVMNAKKIVKLIKKMVSVEILIARN